MIGKSQQQLGNFLHKSIENRTTQHGFGHIGIMVNIKLFPVIRYRHCLQIFISMLSRRVSRMQTTVLIFQVYISWLTVVVFIKALMLIFTGTHLIVTMRWRQCLGKTQKTNIIYISLLLHMQCTFMFIPPIFEPRIFGLHSVCMHMSCVQRSAMLGTD